MTKCAAIATGVATRKGKASLEFFYRGKPHYYCYGYIDRMTDELLPCCHICKANVRFAQDDMDKLTGGVNDA